MFIRKRSSLKTLALQEHKQAQTLTQAGIDLRMQRINDDFERGFQMLKKHQNTVTFFGSARFERDNPYYKQARALAKKIVEELGVAIVTGGGKGIMQAANQGANDMKGSSIGMTIELPYEQVTNDYVNHSVDFYYFFSRKVALSFAARGYVYLPGGFGTLDELFEILTLKQTGKINPVPIILVGTKYWQPLVDFIENQLVDQQAISPKDTKLYALTDDHDEVVRLIAENKTAATNITK